MTVWDLPADVRSAARARGHLREELHAVRAQEAVDAAELLASEVVTNAVLHGGTAVTFGVTVADGRVRVEVSDASPLLPVVRPADLSGTGGRGMALVEALAERWGVGRRSSGGKTVWFELPV